MSLKRTLRKALPYCIGVGLLAFIWFILSTNEMIDAFLYPRLAYGELLRNRNRLEIIRLDRTPLGDPGGVPFYELLILILIKVTGISGAQLALLPIGGIIVAFTYFALSKRFFASGIIALILTLTLCYEPSFFASMYNVGYHAWAFSLYSVAMLSFINLMAKRRRSNIICLLLLSVAIQFIHPVAALWVILIPLSFAVAYLFEQKDRPTFFSIRSALVIFSCLLIINFVTTNSLNAFVKTSGRVGLNLQQMFETFIERIISTVIKSKPSGSPIHIQELRSPIVGLTELAYHFVTITPVVAYLLVSVIARMRKSKGKKFARKFNVKNLLVWVGATTSIVTVLVYLQIAGYPGTKYNLFFFPLVSTGAIWLLTRKSKRIIMLFIFVLLSINLSKFALVSNGIFASTRYSSMQEDTEWLLANLCQNTTILSDFPTCGIIELSWSALGYVPLNVRSITLRKYSCLYTSDYSCAECSFLRSSYTLMAVNERALQMPFYADNWQLAPPLSPLLENKTFHRIHDGKIIVFVISNSTR